MTVKSNRLIGKNDSRMPVDHSMMARPDKSPQHAQSRQASVVSERLLRTAAQPRKELEMKLSIPVLPAIAFMVTSLCIASANAQTMSQKDYCRALITALQEGLPGPHGILQPDNATAVAVAQCQEGDPGPAIPVLEQKLRDAKISLPKRI
jgi:hypothetical protein